MAKVNAKSSFQAEQTGNISPSGDPARLTLYQNSSGSYGVHVQDKKAVDEWAAKYNGMMKVADEFADAIVDAALGVTKGQTSGKTVAENTKSSSVSPASSIVSSGSSEVPSYSVSVNNSGNDEIMSQLIAMAESNTAKEQEFAREQMRFQEAQNAKAMTFNAEQAAINREWQEMMSNTAHQREVADMMRAGINPVLSVTGGNGATVTSGATASGVTSAGAKGSVDTGVTSALAAIFGQLINAASMENVAKISANSAANVARINNEHDVYMAKYYPNNLMQLANAFLNGYGYTANDLGEDIGQIIKGLHK